MNIRRSSKSRMRFYILLIILVAVSWFGVEVFKEIRPLKDTEVESISFENRPELKDSVDELAVISKSALSVFVGDEQKILFEKDSSSILAIASLTKLMTALVVFKNYNLKEQIVLTKDAVGEEGNTGFLNVGDTFLVQDLLYPLLIESSNDAAAALIGIIGKDEFINKMNQEAWSLGLTKTVFVNATGLDPDDPKGPINYSTASDLAKLSIYIKENYPEIFEILSLSKFNLYDSRGWFHHTLINTNELLSRNGWPTRVLGGKTGWTPEADGALILILEGPKHKGYLVQVILGTNDRFGQMKTLVDWIYKSYKW